MTTLPPADSPASFAEPQPPHAPTPQQRQHCKYCNQFKPVSEFHANLDKPNSLSSFCKACAHQRYLDIVDDMHSCGEAGIEYLKTLRAIANARYYRKRRDELKQHGRYLKHDERDATILRSLRHHEHVAAVLNRRRGSEVNQYGVGLSIAHRILFALQIRAFQNLYNHYPNVTQRRAILCGLPPLIGTERLSGSILQSNLRGACLALLPDDFKTPPTPSQLIHARRHARSRLAKATTDDLADTEKTTPLEEKVADDTAADARSAATRQETQYA